VDVLRSKGRGVCAIAAVDHFYYVKIIGTVYCEYSYGIDTSRTNRLDSAIIRRKTHFIFGS